MSGAIAAKQHRTGWRLPRLGPLWLALPGVIFLCVFFAYPVAQLLGLSLVDPATGAFSTATYQRIAGTDVYLRVLGITFRIAGYTALYSLLIGYPLAYWLARLPDMFRGRMLLFVMVPFWTSYLVKTFAWMIVLGRSGIINALATGSGLVDQPLALLHNEFGVMVGMVHAMVPLAVMTLLPVMAGIDRRLVQAAQTLEPRRYTPSGWSISSSRCPASPPRGCSSSSPRSASSSCRPSSAGAARPCWRSSSSPRSRSC